MIGTYSTIPDLGWAVIAQRSLEKARDDAGVNELNAQALTFVLVVTFAALILGYLFAVGISTPIRALAASTRAISRGEFHERAPVARRRGNQRTGRKPSTTWPTISRASSPGSSRPPRKIASSSSAPSACSPRPSTKRIPTRAAIPTAWPNTPCSSASNWASRRRNLDRLRISALLHDVGKIGVDDRVLKKPGALTAEEFEIMKQHPTKGANIMRPVAQLKDMLPGIELHHEHVDGNGYPYGLRATRSP